MNRLMRVLWLFILMSAQQVKAGEDYSIVFVHLGKEIPAYAETSFAQARIFNPDCPIILLANEQALLNYVPAYPNLNLTMVACESLTMSEAHSRFLRESTLNRDYMDGFWLFTSERFLCLSELMTDYELKNVFHLEYDNMLYVDLGEMVPLFEEYYPGIGATFDNDNRCVAGFIYISNHEVMELLAQQFADTASMGQGFNGNDMYVLGSFRSRYGPEFMDKLPIICTEYVEDHPLLISPYGHIASNRFEYCNHFDKFNSIFDAAALGQYLGGISPVHGDRQIGFINESCVFNPSEIYYEWGEDEQGRKVLYGLYGTERFRINSLHIHSKDLKMFFSDEI